MTSTSPEPPHSIRSRPIAPPPSVAGRIVRTAEHWLWTAAVNGGGYPVVSWDGRVILVSRLLYHRKFGGDLPGRLHPTCPERRCVHPDHRVPARRDLPPRKVFTPRVQVPRSMDPRSFAPPPPLRTVAGLMTRAEMPHAREWRPTPKKEDEP